MALESLSKMDLLEHAPMRIFKYTDKILRLWAYVYKENTENDFQVKEQ